MDYRYQILLHSTRPLSNQLRVGVELLGGSFPPPRLNFPGITTSSRQYWCDMEVACEGQTRTAIAICETDIASKSASLWFPIHNHRPGVPSHGVTHGLTARATNHCNHSNQILQLIAPCSQCKPPLVTLQIKTCFEVAKP